MKDIINAISVSEGMKKVMELYHAEDLCFQELFAGLRFPKLTAGEVISLYSRLSSQIDGDDIIICRSCGDSDRL